VANIRGAAPAGEIARLAAIDGSTQSITTKAGRNGAFEFPNVSAGWYIIALGNVARAILVVQGGVDAGAFKPLSAPRATQGTVPVLTVCEALARRDSLSYQRLVIIGIFKSGMDETLRLDCPTQLMSGELGWPSSIGLTRPSQPPDNLRAQVERKRQEIIKSSPPEAPLRPERVVGLYGMFVSLAGLTAAPCCSAAVETVLPPARLFGIAETDLSVIR